MTGLSIRQNHFFFFSYTHIVYQLHLPCKGGPCIVKVITSGCEVKVHVIEVIEVVDDGGRHLVLHPHTGWMEPLPVIIILITIIVILIVIIIKNFNRRDPHGHHGSKCRELAQHAHSHGSHAFTHTRTSTTISIIHTLAVY